MKKDWYLLSIYCIDTIPIIAIYWNCLVSSNAHDVSYRLDNDTIIKAQCVGLGDGKTSAFSLRSDSLLQKLKSASMLRLAVVTTLEGRKTLTFDIRGFEQTVTALSSDCFD